MTDSERQRMADLKQQADWWKLKALEYYKEIRNANKGVRRLKHRVEKLKSLIIELKKINGYIAMKAKKSETEGCLHD
jgi:hypothetical protein